VDPEPWDP